MFNESAARQYFGTADPLGRRLRPASDLTRVEPIPPDSLHPFVYNAQRGRGNIVGVVGDARYRTLALEDDPGVYFVQSQGPTRRFSIVVRSEGAAEATIADAIRSTLSEMDPQLPIEVQPMPTIVSLSVVRERFSMTLILMFGITALALASMGIYGVVSYSVVQRTTEVAIRSAIGATPSNQLAMIMQFGARLTLGGVVLGIGTAMAARRVLESQLYGITSLDIPVLAGVPIVLTAVAALATWLPARRVLRIDLADTLRRE